MAQIVPTTGFSGVLWGFGAWKPRLAMGADRDFWLVDRVMLDGSVLPKRFDLALQSGSRKRSLRGCSDPKQPRVGRNACGLAAVDFRRPHDRAWLMALRGPMVRAKVLFPIAISTWIIRLANGVSPSHSRVLGASRLDGNGD